MKASKGQRKKISSSLLRATSVDQMVECQEGRGFESHYGREYLVPSHLKQI